MPERKHVGDVMTATVVTVGPESRLDEAARLLRAHHISGMPVVDRARSVVGLLSEQDIVRALHRATGVHSARGLLDLLLESAPPKGDTMLEVCRRHLRNSRVREAMTSPVVSVARETPLEEAAHTMTSHRVKRLPVLDAHGALVGIVSRADLAHAVSGAPRARRGSLRPGPAPLPAGGSGPFEDV